jgi:cob(I)alamin adenosyltransferase
VLSGNLTGNSQASPDRGLVEVLIGDGKGKISTASGVVLRASGHDSKIFTVFFMKGSFPYREQKTLSQLPNVTFARFGPETFVDPNNVTKAHKKEAKRALNAAWKLIDIDEVIKLIREKPEKVELILTGRYANDKLVDLADLVTDMTKVKHPYDKAISARKGVDY